VISKTDAIVLHTRRFRESSKIVTLYTREFGKIGVVAKGAMQTRSRIAAMLQPMAVISTVIYRKEGRELQNLSKAEPLERFARIETSLEAMSAGLTIVELVNATMHDEERHEELYETIVEALRALGAEGDETSVLLWFMARLAHLLGYSVRTGSCGVCDEPIAVDQTPQVPYSIAMGAPLCSEHRDAGSYWPMIVGAYDLLDQLQEMSAQQAARLRVDEASKTALNDALVAFVRYHVEGLRRLNVSNVMGKVLRSEPMAPAGPQTYRA
jgi:DNA repair protein RecO (recombination protein O)